MERALIHLRSKLPNGDCGNDYQEGTRKAISGNRFNNVEGNRGCGLK